MAEDSGTDLRINAVAKVISDYARPDAIDRENACKVLIAIDAADRAAGWVRVRANNAAMLPLLSRLSHVLELHYVYWVPTVSYAVTTTGGRKWVCRCGEMGRSANLTDPKQHIARAVLAALLEDR